MAGWKRAGGLDGSEPRASRGGAGAGQFARPGSGLWGGKGSNALPAKRSRPSPAAGEDPRQLDQGPLLRPTASTGTSKVIAEPSGLDLSMSTTSAVAGAARGPGDQPGLRTGHTLQRLNR